MLTLARDLLQATDLKTVLELLGPALQELLEADETLLLVTLGDQEFVTAFDRRGFLQRGDRDGVLYRNALRALNDRTPMAVPALALAADGEDSDAKASLVALPFPPIKPIGVLAGLWGREARPALVEGRLATLRNISELVAAALGNIDFRISLEEEISSRTEELKQAAHARAVDLDEREEIEDEIRQLAVTDVLTGMLNRRGFFLHAEQTLKIARRQGKVAAVIMADIEGLKNVNDELGHDVGDRLIQASSQILKSSFRDSDVVARLGAGQFAAFALDSRRPDVILGRVRKNVEDFQRKASTPYRVALATGIVQCNPSSAIPLADYLAMADQRMSDQKN